jgi:predicted MFS family arabinose efflux permease
MAQPPSPGPEGQTSEAPAASLRIIAAVITAWSMSLLASYAQPQLLGPIMRDRGLGEEAVGWLFSLENAALAVTIIAAAGPLARWSRSGVAIAGALLACAANAASPFVESYEGLLLARWLVGMGSGLVGAAGTAAAASTRNPERVFAIATVGSSLVFNALPTVIPFATVPFSSTGGFFLLAGASLALAPLFRWLPPAREAPEEKPSLLAAPNRVLALVAMLSLFIFEVGQGAVWTFVAQIGEYTGLGAHATGRGMTVAGLLGLFGGVVAAWLGNRIGYRVPIAIGVGLNTVAAVGLALTDDPITYVVLLWLWTASYTFVVPYLMGALAVMDDLGRWVVASDGVWTLGDAVGPGIGGFLVERGGYAPLGSLALVTGVICVVVMVEVMRRFQNGKGRPSDGARATPDEGTSALPEVPVDSG